MARKKKFEPNDSSLAIAYFRFSSPSQNEATLLLHQQVIESQRCDSFFALYGKNGWRGGFGTQIRSEK